METASMGEERFPATPASVPTARGRVRAFITAHGASEQLAADVSLAVTEAVSNAVRHA